MMATWYEMMHAGMHKIHGMDGTVWHIFFGNKPDLGDPHDHPWPFRSEIIFGGYVEEVFDPQTGARQVFHRKVGHVFDVGVDTIHKIVDFPEGHAITRIWPGNFVRPSGFWRWAEGKSYRRPHDADWAEVPFPSQ